MHPERKGEVARKVEKGERKKREISRGSTSRVREKEEELLVVQEKHV